MNSLILAIIALPLFNCLSSMLINNSRIKNFVEKFSMIAFFAILIGLYNKLENLNSLEIIALAPDLSMSFAITNTNASYLFLLIFIWLAYGFYAERFLVISGNQNAPQFKLFFALAIAFINLIILANNLLTLLFAYNCLVLTCYFLTTKFLFKTHNNLAKIFTFLMFGETLLLLFAIVITAKFGEQVAFNEDGVLNNVSEIKTACLFLLYFGGIMLTILGSSYLLYYKNYDADSPLSYLFLPLFLGFAKLYIFIKIISEIFGIGVFSSIITKIDLEIIALIFLINLAISTILLLFSRDFKAISFHLFFSQLVVAFFTIIIYAIYSEEAINSVLPNFILSITLVFLTFSNLILYLKKAENKEISGLFYHMKITVLLLLFGFLNLSGAVPALGMMEKYSLLKIALQNNLFLVQIFFITNSICLFLFTIKLFFPIFLKAEIVKSEHDKKLAEKIDTASSLMLSALVVAVIIFVLPIIQFFSK